MLDLCGSSTECLLQNLCFTKKIRYESRKQLAQARPRVKGQFVRVRSGDMEEVVDALEKQVRGFNGRLQSIFLACIELSSNSQDRTSSQS